MKNFKSKIITFVLAFCLIVPCIFMLTACKEQHVHSLTKVDAVAATCTAAGNSQYYKCDCGKYFSDDKAENEIAQNSWVVAATGHAPTKVDAVAATCTVAGNSQYYECVCGKYFSDAEAENEIAQNSWVVAATGHSFASTWTYNETHHWKEATCSHSTEKDEYAEHSITNNHCTCGYVAIINTVEEADWNDVFTGDYLINGTVTIENNYYINEILAPEQSSIMVMKSTEDAMVMVMEEESQYLVKNDDDGKWYGLAEYNNAWYGVEMSENEVYVNSFAGGQGFLFVDQFDSFEYDEDNKCYVIEDFVIDEEYNIVADYLKVYIENGKLIKMEMGSEVTLGLRTETVYLFTDYGTTVIEVPDWTIYED